jgi:hypothetical protein
MAECLVSKKVESKSHPAGQRSDTIGIEIAPFRKYIVGKKGKGFPLCPKIVA